MLLNTHRRPQQQSPVERRHSDGPGHHIPAPRSLAGRAASVLLALALLLAAAGSAGALDASVHGSYKSYLTGLYDISYQENLYGMAGNTLRLDTDLHFGRSLSLALSYGLTPEVSTDTLLNSPALSLGGGEIGYRAFELPRRLYPEKDGELENLGVYQNLDRAHAALYLPFGDLFVGRQAISWGSARVVGPTDVIAPYSFSRIDTEEKPGVDAVRLRLPVGMMNEIDLGYVAGEDFEWEKSAAYARGKFYLLQTDISLLAMDFKENLLAGFDMTRSLGGAGSWVEAAWVLPDTFASGGADTAQQYLTASGGLDYTFTGKLYGYAEYHYNGAGTDDAADYPTAADLAAAPEDYPAYTEGSVYLLGRHYLNVGGTYQLTPLLPVSALAIVNLRDPSANVSLSAEYNFTEGVYLTGGFYLGFGEEPQTAGGMVSEYASEFGASPGVLYTGVKCYF
jgi:hypothetical protein